jgi:erythromycin esterase
MLTWWTAVSHLSEMFGTHYAVINSALGISEANEIDQPKVGTLEARLTNAPDSMRLIPTHRGQRLPASEIADIPTRPSSTKNPTYFALTPQSFTDFDWLVVLSSTTKVVVGRGCNNEKLIPSSKNLRYKVIRAILKTILRTLLG